MSATDSGRGRARNFTFGLAAFFGLVALISWWSGREDLRPGSRPADGAPISVEEIPNSYRAVVSVENHAGEKLNITTERVWMRRPFDTRTETWRGEVPGKQRLTILHSAFGILTSSSVGGSTPLNVSVPPSLASGDIRVDPALKEALRDRVIVKRERREVYGRPCQVYRAGGPVSSGDLKRYDGDDEYADVCVDRNGLILEEYWVIDEELAQRRAVVELEIDTAIDPKLFEIDVPEEEGFNRGSVERVDGPRTTGWVLEDPPSGYEDLGRYIVVISPNAVPQLSGAPTLGPTSTTDVYVRGPDLLVIDQDPSLAEATRSEGRQTKPVKLRNFTNAVLIYDARMNEVRGTDADGSVVRVLGTLAPSELVKIAERLSRAG